MSQLLHILKKDIRYLRYEFGIYLLLLGWYAWLETRVFPGLYPSRPDVLLSVRDIFTPVLLVFVSIYLISRSIHAEAIPGDNQFWVTRPYSWMSLLGAKLVLLLLGVSLPLLVVRFVVFRIQGFPLFPGTWHLLWSQFVMTIAIALPIAALAALSSGLVEFVIFALILIPLAAIVVSDAVWLNAWPENVRWLRTSFAAVALVAVAVWVLHSQYKTRKTVFARGFATCALVVAGIAYGYVPWSFAYAVNGWLGLSQSMTDTSSPHVILGPQLKFQPEQPGDVVVWHLPIVVQGLPSGYTAELQPIFVTLQSSGKSIRQWVNPGRALTTEAEPTWWIIGSVARSYFDSTKGSPVTLNVSVQLIVLPPASKEMLHLSKIFANVTGGLQCRGIPVGEWHGRSFPLRKFEGAECRAPFQWPDLRFSMMTTEGLQLSQIPFVSPDSAEDTSAVSLASARFHVIDFAFSGPDDVTYAVQGPPQHLNQEFEFRNIRFDDVMEIR